MLWGLQPVAAPNTSSVAVAWLRGQIQSGLLLPGEKLPPERRLAEQIAISRVTLREALKTLEGMQYIVVKRGAQGGAFVADSPQIQRMALRTVRRDPAAAMRVLEFRGMIEPMAARLAAARREIPDVKRIDGALERLVRAETAETVRQSETLFRLAIAEAAHNMHVFRAIQESLSELFLPYPKGNSNADLADARARFTAIHDAVASRHEREAEAAMRAVTELDWVRLRTIATPSGR